MDFLQDNNMRGNTAKIVSFIFRGMTLTQMAMELGCTKSTVSYHIKRIYAKHNAKTRSEFILSMLAKLIDKYKKTIETKNEQFLNLENENNEMKTILSGLLFSKNSPENFNCWEIKAKKYL